MATTEEILEALTGNTYNPDQEPQLQRGFEKANSVVEYYSGLVTGHGYDFNAFPSPVQSVGHAKRPLIPMMISIVPPRNFPTGNTTTKRIPSPQTANVRLSGMSERFSTEDAKGASTTTVDQVVATSPSTTMEVEVPAYNDDGLDADDPRFLDGGEALIKHQRQEDARNYYLTEMRNRYEQFQNSSREAGSRLSEMNTPITGKARRALEDPFSENNDIQRARRSRVQDDLDFLREQALYMSQLPPLFMYVNPETFSKSYEFIVSDANHTRDGFTVEFWGEQQPKINASGKVGVFYINRKDSLGNPAGGLAVGSRKGSYAYQQFLSLYQVYRSNGYIYNTDHRISLVGAVSIFYDGTIYTGSFDSFSLTHSESSPFTFDYNWSFTVRYEQRLERS